MTTDKSLNGYSVNDFEKQARRNSFKVSFFCALFITNLLLKELFFIFLLKSKRFSKLIEISGFLLVMAFFCIITPTLLLFALRRAKIKEKTHFSQSVVHMMKEIDEFLKKASNCNLLIHIDNSWNMKNLSIINYLSSIKLDQIDSKVCKDKGSFIECANAFINYINNSSNDIKHDILPIDKTVLFYISVATSAFSMALNEKFSLELASLLNEMRKIYKIPKNKLSISPVAIGFMIFFVCLELLILCAIIGNYSQEYNRNIHNYKLFFSKIKENTNNKSLG